MLCHNLSSMPNVDHFISDKKKHIYHVSYSLNYLSNLAVYIILLLHIFKTALLISSIKMSRRGRDRMVVRCTTTYVIRAYLH
jgi:hypothetical protein